MPRYVVSGFGEFWGRHAGEEEDTLFQMAYVIDAETPGKAKYAAIREHRDEGWDFYDWDYIDLRCRRVADDYEFPPLAWVEGEPVSDEY